jgi:RND superfamily putative drug exporter
MAHAGRSVVFSGLTVAIGLLALVVLPVSFLRSTGFAGLFVPLVSVAVAITLLPVILAGAGLRLDWPRLRRERTASRPWTAWASLVYRHKWASALAGAAVLSALMLPAFGMHIGVADSVATANPSPARTTMLTLIRGGVPSGVLTPIEVLVSGEGRVAADVASRAVRIPGVATAVESGYQLAGTALAIVVPAQATGSPTGQSIVARVRAALGSLPRVLGVGGDGPALADFDHAIYGNFALMLTLIGIATFLLLARAFRSVLLAAKAVLFNLVSLGAAFGVMSFVWQDGHGSRLWGVSATGDITMWVKGVRQARTACPS